jgi:hypothetical protein
MADWRAEVQAWCRERRYRDSIRERWLGLPAADAEALWAVARELRLGENQLRDLWQWAEEIAARDGSSLQAVLEAPEIRAALERRLSRNDRLRLLRHALRRRRFPELAAVEDELHALVHAAGLPAHVRLELPVDLEGDAVQVRLVARTAEELVQGAAALLRWADSDACRRLFALLEEAP